MVTVIELSHRYTSCSDLKRIILIMCAIVHLLSTAIIVDC